MHSLWNNISFREDTNICSRESNPISLRLAVYNAPLLLGNVDMHQKLLIMEKLLCRDRTPPAMPSLILQHFQALLLPIYVLWRENFYLRARIM